MADRPIQTGNPVPDWFFDWYKVLTGIDVRYVEAFSAFGLKVIPSTNGDMHTWTGEGVVFDDNGVMYAYHYSPSQWPVAPEHKYHDNGAHVAAAGGKKRKDLIQIKNDGTISIKKGAEVDADPVCPSPDANNVALSCIGEFTDATTKVTSGMITDLKPSLYKKMRLREMPVTPQDSDAMVENVRTEVFDYVEPMRKAPTVVEDDMTALLEWQRDVNATL